MILSLILMFLSYGSASGAPAAPHPAPTPHYKVIINLRSRAICSTLHDLVLPFAKRERMNNIRFRQMDQQLGIYNKWKAKTAADIGANGDTTPNGAELLAAANMDHLAARTYSELAKTERDLKTSYVRYPKGRNAHIDQLRARIENIVKLQYALADRYEQLAGRTLDSLHNEIVEDPAYSSQMLIPDYNSDPILQATPVPAGSITPPGTSDAPVSPDFLARANPNDVVRGMMTQEVAFLRPALQAVHTCGGG